MAEYPSVIKVNGETERELLQDHNGEKTGWYQVGLNKYLLPSKYADEVNEFINIQTRPDDVWLSTFPRTGTTVMQELVWLLLHNCDTETAKKVQLWDRSPFLELDLFFHEETKNKFLQMNVNNEKNRQIIENMSKPVYKYIDDLKSPRVIKTHFPPSLLPHDIKKTNAKIIYLARNPKDVMVSYYYLLKLWLTSDYTNTFEQWFNQFVNGLVPWSPFWSHVKEGWDKKNEPNFLFIFYEDLAKDLVKTIKTVAKFLSISLKEEDIDKLVGHLDIKIFKNNPAVNFESLRGIGVLNKNEESFIRQGAKRGEDIKFTDEMIDTLNKWVRNQYEQTDLRFPSKT